MIKMFTLTSKTDAPEIQYYYAKMWKDTVEFFWTDEEFQTSYNTLYSHEEFQRLLDKEIYTIIDFTWLVTK